MAVKPQQIRDRVKALFPNANLSTKRLDELAARLATKPADDADDTAIDTVINNANDFMSFDDIAKEDDRIRTLEQKAKVIPEPPKVDPPKVDPPKSDDTPEWAKALLAKNEKLEADLNSLITGKVTETKLQEARKLFNESSVFKSITDEKAKEFLFKQVDANSDIGFDEQIKELESTYSNLVQSKADSLDYAGTPPIGQSNNKPSEAEMDSIIDSANR